MDNESERIRLVAQSDQILELMAQALEGDILPEQVEHFLVEHQQVLTRLVELDVGEVCLQERLNKLRQLVETIQHIQQNAEKGLNAIHQTRRLAKTYDAQR
ncbi:hypothetical protein [Celerinatantimonas sp. YJH-8]|uniref:hypothetical protein n=1 Tax=Celerinatantimonas sp. YJH-8 TaxID=3228714 RepID=UPI0038C46D29